MKRPLLSIGFGLLVWLMTSNVMAQPRFGIEVGIGQSAGITAYSNNVVYVDDNVPYLADEDLDAGFALALMFVFERLEVGVDVRWFARDELSVHHQGNDTLPSGRIRPDGTVDDSGVTYSEIPDVTINAPSNRGDLFLMSVVAGYRLYFLNTKRFELYVPFTGGLAVTHIQEDSRPYEFGLQASTGFGVSVDIAAPVAVTAVGRLHGVLTPSYGSQADASRSTANTSGGTATAMFDTFVFGSVIFGVQFTIR